jgi:hypothetical protein
MRLRQYSRPLLALVAAYAIALQAVLLVVAGPMSGPGSVVAPLCSHAGGGSGGTGPAPAGRGCDCLATCLAGCCGAAAAPAPRTAIFYAPGLLRTAVAAPVASPAPRLSAAAAHRSRAPPLA